jgi:hypothetical protein
MLFNDQQARSAVLTGGLEQYETLNGASTRSAYERKCATPSTL